MLWSLCLCLIVIGITTSHSYSQEEITRAQIERDAWWKEQDNKYNEAKKKEAMQFIEQHDLPEHLHATDPNDKLALERFYTSTNGPQWANNSGWMKGDPCLNYWYGLYCSESGRILQINLVYNLLSGVIPPDIGRLDQLQVLRLYSNDITAMTDELFTLGSLQVLDLDSNEIEGSFPSSISMANLTTMNMYSNKISGTIPSEWNTPNLQILALSSNKLQGELPPSIGKLRSLQQLVLSNNLLTGTFPPEYGQLTNLQQLWIFSNNFNEPTFPASWSGLKSLTNVEIDGVHGEFPDYIGNSWTEIENLLIVNGQLKGSFPSSLCSLKKIKDLFLYNNSFSGDLPDCICELPKSLVALELSDNQFTGPIPKCIGKLSNLINLYLSRNELTGTLPLSMGNLTHLEILDVSSNGLYGSVPSTLNDLAGYTVQLSLCYNKLSSVDNGLEKLFDFVKDYSCLLYNNPWNCPLPSFVPKECQATCGQCNSGENHKSCSKCIGSDGCGWCNEGGNCLPGSSANGPDDDYKCNSSDWTFGSNAQCPSQQ